jgi:hypothetical protein
MKNSQRGKLLKTSQGGSNKMATIMPEAENVQKAIKWISGSLEDGEGQPLHVLIEKAVFKFDLSPKDSEFLLGFFRNHKK